MTEDPEQLSTQQTADRLGLSRQHVERLVNAGELSAEQAPGSHAQGIPVAAVVAFEERRERNRQRADAFTRSLDELGAPPE